MDFTKTITISLIVCSFNRADDLAFTLDRLFSMEVPAGSALQLIVVDNNSSDHTSLVVKSAAARAPFPVDYVCEPRPGLAAARNCGLRHATGDILAWTDDDCVVSEDWLVRMLGHFRADRSLDMLGGRVELFDKSHLPLTILTRPDPTIMDATTFPGGLLLGCNMAFRRRIAERIGGFDTRFGAGGQLRSGEDAEFLYRAFKAGYRVGYFPDVIVYHNHKRTTTEQGVRLRRDYSHAEGAYLMKHIMRGDRNSLKWLYWSLSNSVYRAARRPLSFRNFQESMVLSGEIILGAWAFLLTSQRPDAAHAADGGRI